MPRSSVTLLASSIVTSLAMVRAYDTCDLGPGTQASPVNATLGRVEGSFFRTSDWVGTNWGSQEEWRASVPGCSKGCVSFNMMCTSAGNLQLYGLVKIMCPRGDCGQSDSAWVRCSSPATLQPFKRLCPCVCHCIYDLSGVRLVSNGVCYL